MSTTTTHVTVQVPKSTFLAYVLWFFFGGLGVHRFYLGRTGSAVAQLLLGILGVILSVVGIGFIGLGVLAVWLIADIFLIPGLVRKAVAVTLQTTTVTTSDASVSETPPKSN